MIYQYSTTLLMVLELCHIWYEQKEYLWVTWQLKTYDNMFSSFDTMLALNTTPVKRSNVNKFILMFNKYFHNSSNISAITATVLDMTVLSTKALINHINSIQTQQGWKEVNLTSRE